MDFRIHRVFGGHLAVWLSVVYLFTSAAMAFGQGRPDYPSRDRRTQCLLRPLLPSCDIVRIDVVVVEGLMRTERSVVMQELLFEEGEYVSRSRVEESVQRLLNLGLFREVRYELRDQSAALPDGSSPAEEAAHSGRVLVLTVDERWTLLPFFSFTRGGNLFRLSVGLSDINAFGRYVELGAQYNRLGEANSVVLWLRDPRFLGEFLLVGADLWIVNRPRVLFDQDGQVEGGFLLERVYTALRTRKEWQWWFRTGAAVEFAHDRFEFEYVSDQAKQAQRANFGGLPPQTRAVFLSADATWGRLDQSDYFFDGTRFSQRIRHTDELWGATTTFTQLQSEFLWFKRLPWRSNLGFRAELGVSNAEQVQNLFFLGGLTDIRGFRDSRFRGPSYWLANAEFRIASIESRWFVLQHNFFVDAGTVGQSPRVLDRITAASLGAGLRVISPKIFSFVARIDYAVPMIKEGDAYLNFGAQQFF